MKNNIQPQAPAACIAERLAMAEIAAVASTRQLTTLSLCCATKDALINELTHALHVERAERAESATIAAAPASADSVRLDWLLDATNKPMDPNKLTRELIDPVYRGSEQTVERKQFPCSQLK